MAKQDKKLLGVMLVNLGTPDAPTPSAIRRYLAEFLSDRRVVNISPMFWLPILYGFILPFRPKRLIEPYESIWLEEDAPIRVYTQSVAERLEDELNKAQLNRKIVVKSAMTYGNPSMAHAVDSFQAEGIEEIMVVPLFPQYAVSTTAAVFDKLAKVMKKRKIVPELRFITDYHDLPRYVHAISKSIDNEVGILAEDTKLIFSFHGIPQSEADAGDPYPNQCHESAQRIAAALGLSEDQWQVCFQSRFGPAPWLQPYTSETMEKLPKQGVKKVVVVCPGFATDCLETVEEINIENREIFMEAGGESFNYVPALNDSDSHVELLEELILNRLYRSDFNSHS